METLYEDKKIGQNRTQKISKSKLFKILNKDKKDYNKVPTFCKENTSLVYLLTFECHLNQKANKQTKQQKGL